MAVAKAEPVHQLSSAVELRSLLFVPKNTRWKGVGLAGRCAKLGRPMGLQSSRSRR